MGLSCADKITYYAVIEGEGIKRISEIPYSGKILEGYILEKACSNVLGKNVRRLNF